MTTAIQSQENTMTAMTPEAMKALPEVLAELYLALADYTRLALASAVDEPREPVKRTLLNAGMATGSASVYVHLLPTHRDAREMLDEAMYAARLARPCSEHHHLMRADESVRHWLWRRSILPDVRPSNDEWDVSASLDDWDPRFSTDD